MMITYLSPREMNSMKKPARKDPIKLTFFRPHHHNTSTFLSSCGLLVRLTFIQMKIQNKLHGSRTWFTSSIIFGSISQEMPNRIHQSYIFEHVRVTSAAKPKRICVLYGTLTLSLALTGHAFWNIYFYWVKNVSEVRRNAFERRKRIMDQHKYNVSTVWRSNRMISANGTSFSRWICEHESMESSQVKKTAEFPYIYTTEIEREFADWQILCHYLTEELPYEIRFKERQHFRLRLFVSRCFSVGAFLRTLFGGRKSPTHA